MILDATTKTLELVLGSAVTTTAMPIAVDYVDSTATAFTPGSVDSQSNGTTAVTILAAPAASTQRKVNEITVYNADSAAKLTTVRLNNNTTIRPLVVVTLQVGDTLGYTDVSGWYVMDSSGAIKGVGPTGATGATGANGANGATGMPGIDGQDGQDGMSIPGDRGATGPQGGTGPTGPIGWGLPGDDGEDALHIPGPVGPAGSAGSSMTLATAQATTSGTAIDFTGIPSGIKRITVIFNGVSTNSTSRLVVRIGTGGVPTTSGYAAQTSIIYTTVATAAETTGFPVYYDSAAFTITGSMVIHNISGNIWVMSAGGSCNSGTAFAWVSGGSVTLSGVLNFLRVTTLTPDTFDAGSVNILYEG